MKSEAISNENHHVGPGAQVSVGLGAGGMALPRHGSV